MTADELIKRIVALKDFDDCNKQFTEVVTDLRSLTPKDIVMVFKESMKGNFIATSYLYDHGEGRPFRKAVYVAYVEEGLI